MDEKSQYKSSNIVQGDDVIKDAIIAVLFGNMAIIDLERRAIRPGLKAHDALALRVHAAISQFHYGLIELEAMKEMLKREINWFEMPGQYALAYYVVEAA